MPALTTELERAIDTELASISPTQLRALVQHLSLRYRERAFGRLDPTEVQAYAAFRLPATFGAVTAAFQQIHRRLGAWFNPRTLLDLGAGPGTVMWSALDQWPTLEHMTLVENDANMTALGRRLQSYAIQAPIARAVWIDQDLRQPWSHPTADLVVASYVLGELDPQVSWALIQSIWRHPPKVLVVIEPGTPIGFSTVRLLRQRLIDHGARVLAPCPHDRPCPLEATDWCHFGARIPRSRVHRLVKYGTLGYEDEKYSFVAVTPEPASSPPGERILRRPEPAKGHVRLRLCTASGVTEQVVTAKDGLRYKQARHASWGGEMPPH